MDKYPVPAQAIFHPNFPKLTTKSSQIFLVNKWGHHKVTTEATSGSSVVIYGKTPNNSIVPISINSDGTVNVAFDYAPGEPKGEGTNPTSGGKQTYNNSVYSTLDTVSMSVGDKIDIYGVHAVGNGQAEVDIVVKQGPTVIRHLLLGVVTESNPNWSPNIGNAAIEYTATANQTIELRIKALRNLNRTYHGSGRLFARKA